MTLAVDMLGTGRTILFLHGAFSHRRVFGYQLLDLSREFHVVTPDLPGYGGSPWDPSRAWDDQATDALLSLLETLGADAPVIVGWSLGGLVAARVAARLPDARLVLVGVSGEPLDQKVRDTMSRRLLSDFPRYALSMVRAFTSSSVSPETEQWLFSMALSTGPDVCIASLLGSELPLDIPETAVSVGGAHDQIVPPALRIHAGGGDVVFEASGHTPFLEERRRFNDVIVELAK